MIALCSGFEDSCPFHIASVIFPNVVHLLFKEAGVCVLWREFQFKTLCQIQSLCIEAWC